MNTLFAKFRNNFYCSISIFLLLLSFNSKAQAPYFTWTSGSNTLAQLGIYGTKGIAAPSNIPGAREASVSWKDNSGNLWVFGGTITATTTANMMNDLWKFNIATNMWTWVSGSNVSGQNGIYGTKGVPSTTNVPGARKSAAGWVDNAGNFWVYGGIGKDAASSSLGYLCDLWKYNPTTNEWTWVSGTTIKDDFGSFGTKGVSNSTNVPPSRMMSTAWTDLTGNLWLFAGSGIAGITQDLWKFNITLNQWVWVSGTNLASQNGVYGTKGLMNATNLPGSRVLSGGWRDNAGNFWLYGGSGWDVSKTFSMPLGDLWKYDPLANQWVWMNGSDTSNLIGKYGVKGVATATNDVGSRTQYNYWKDLNGDFWLFGGTGNKPIAGGGFNDLWKYSVSTNQWTWMAGTNLQNQNANYGTLGVTAPTNISGARVGNCNWVDANGYLWLFGGVTRIASVYNHVNDLWKIDLTGLMTGINENASLKSKLSVFPNPSAGDFTIKGSATETLLLLNNLGQIVKKVELNSANNFSEKIEIAESGIYYLNGEKIVVIK